MMSKLLNWIKNRWAEKGTKASILAVIGGIGTYFGLDLSPEQNVAVFGVLGIIISAISAATKTAKPEDPEKIL